MYEKQFYEAMSMADYALEGHSRKETAEEFRVSPGTVERRINDLASERPDIYKKVIAVWHKNDSYEGIVV